MAGPTIAQIRAGLIAAAEPRASTALHFQAFCAWLLGSCAFFARQQQTAADGFAAAGYRSAGHVAILGYAAAAGQLAERFRPALEGGLTWLGERAWFRPHQPQTLEADGVAALGVALGARHIGADEQINWLRTLVVRSANSLYFSALDHTLFTAAAHVIAASERLDTAAMLPEARLVFAEHGIGRVDEDCYGASWQTILRFALGDDSVPRSALLLRALDLLTERNLPARLGRLEPHDVLHVLEGVPHSLRRWTWETSPRTPKSGIVRWAIENEYHVQNLLWAVLAPLFPDLNDEETLPPVGQKNPRVDLSIPSLGTVVEVKFMRVRTRFQDVIEEIAADASLYGTDRRWKALIPFVWDDSQRAEEHPKLISGLTQLPLVIGAVVVSRPGKIARASEVDSQAG